MDGHCFVSTSVGTDQLCSGTHHADHSTSKLKFLRGADSIYESKYFNPALFESTCLVYTAQLGSLFWKMTERLKVETPFICETKPNLSV